MLRLSDRAPSVTVPAHVSALSPGANGVAVSYDASAADAFGDALAVTCSTPSGAVFPIGPTVVTCGAVDAAGRAGTGSFTVDVAPPPHPVGVGGTVPATLSLALGGPVSLGSFTPGVAKVYEASAAASVTSTAGGALLSVSEPGHLSNNAFALPRPLQVTGVPRAYGAPVSNDAFSIGFKQPIGAAHGDVLDDADVHALDDDAVARAQDPVGRAPNRLRAGRV